MIVYWIYTAETKQEALVKAQTELDKVNEKYLQIVGSGDWATIPQELTAEPEIEGVVYFYGFEKPPAIFQNGTTYDLEEVFSQQWMIQEN